MSTTTTTTTTTVPRRRKPIGPNDTVSVQGRYLVYDRDGSRFSLQGIAFPTTASSDESKYDEEGHVAVLDQLANLTDINTVRVYRMNCTDGDYFSGFLQHAAARGIYVMLPLTAPSGGGSLPRDKPAPKCYSRRLYDYGTACLDQFLEHPNVLAGVIGNEVMNSLDTWRAAPCVKAYARDLKSYMQNNNKNEKKRTLPLVYAAQHDSFTAEILANEAMKMTVDYLSCKEDNNNNDVDDASIDVFGINVESWCSSLQTFATNEDGTESAYHGLWKALHNVSLPLIFSEMGCSKELFNRDNGLEREVRDWKQVPVVLSDMNDTFSGFCAYTYYGNPVFGMMDPHSAWDGHKVLEPSQDFENFRDQLHAAVTVVQQSNDNENATATQAGKNMEPPPSCQEALKNLQQACTECNFKLVPMEHMPMYDKPNFVRSHPSLMTVLGICIAAALLAAVYVRRTKRQEGYERIVEVTV